MVEKLKKISTKQIVIFSVLAFMLVLVVGTTYAYFTAKVIGNDEAKNTQVYAGIMSLKLDGTQELNASNMLPGASKEVEFSVENTGTLTTTYELDMKEVYNDFSPKTDLVYTLEQDGAVILNETEAPSIDEVILPAVVINPGEKQIYKLKLTFKETGTNQNNNQNKTFTGKIQIDSADKSNYLAAKILISNSFVGSDSDIPNANTKSNNYPTSGDFLNTTAYTTNVRYINLTTANSSITGNKAIGDGYTIDQQTGRYFYLTNAKLDQTFTKDTIGKYYCAKNRYIASNSAGPCLKIVRIEEVKESDATTNYTEKDPVEDTTEMSSNQDKIVGESYTFDENTGEYKIINPITNVNYGSEYVNYYTCNTAEETCTTLYKIKKVEEGKVTSSLKYTRSANYNKVTKGQVYTTTLDLNGRKSGIFSTNDDEGRSYYLRGEITNNYVSFAGRKWQIVRINGNGSIRLISEESIGGSVFANITDNIKAAGYTYDNDHICTSENQCTTNSGTSSAIKEYLEEWYNSNLSNYDQEIELENYCNDTTFSETTDSTSYTYFGINDRMINGMPTLKCPNTKETYGGSYKLKIGLLSGDEMIFSGLGNKKRYGFLNNKNNGWWYMSPGYTFAHNDYIYVRQYRNATYSGAPRDFQQNDDPVFPVINLKSDIQITGGDGSKSNPYTVE
ncbi:MAG TPA: CalY family protein [Bacilli bacterium]|nr:CalY family protein [Bacilli bacterium]